MSKKGCMVVIINEVFWIIVVVLVVFSCGT